jgi:hypothetical protein
MDDAWLGGDDRVTLAAERSMSDCYIAQLRVCAKGASYTYVHTYAHTCAPAVESPQPRAVPLDVK